MIGLARTLRILAIVIAIAGVIDPVATWPLRDKPLVALIAPRASAAADDIARGLERTHTVHRGPIASALSTVIVGTSLPAEPPAVSGVLIAAIPPSAARHVEFVRVAVPGTVSAGSRIPVDVTLRARGANGRTLRVDVSANGILLDRATTVVKADDASIDVPLSAAALALGPARLEIRVRDDAADDPALVANVVAATTVEADRWRVLVVDPRPSWMSTFVRRAIEADRRFVVTSRVGTSRDITVESGHAPSLTDVPSLEEFAAVVVGAPDALTAADVRGLELFARGRGGAVVLLMDRLDRGPFAALTGAASWRDVHSVERRILASPSGALVATELAVANGLVAGADILASGPVVDGAPTPSVWQRPLGAGRVVVSGALDAWRYRTREQNGFARFWSQTIGEAAASAPENVTVTPRAAAVGVGAPLEVRVTVRSVQLSDPSAPAPEVRVSATVTASGEADTTSRAEARSIRLWPTAERGVFAASLSLPDTPTRHHIVAEAARADGVAIGAASADVWSGETAMVAGPDDLAPWVSSRGGVVVPDADAARVASAIAAQVSSSVPLPRVYPMRSLWWWPVFVALLGGEWWLRRRRGDR